jgi:hypothetical protein
MKTLVSIFALMLVSSSIFPQNVDTQNLKYELLGDVQVLLDNPINLGQTPNGIRTIYPIRGGTFEGPKVKGKILNNGADWLLTLDSTTSKLDIREVIQTDDGATIYVTSVGYIHSNPDKSIYFRTIPIFETSSEKYKWLNHTIVVGVGSVIEGGVSLKFYIIK